MIFTWQKAQRHQNLLLTSWRNGQYLVGINLSFEFAKKIMDKLKVCLKKTMHRGGCANRSTATSVINWKPACEYLAHCRPCRKLEHFPPKQRLAVKARSKPEQKRHGQHEGVSVASSACVEPQTLTAGRLSYGLWRQMPRLFPNKLWYLRKGCSSHMKPCDSYSITDISELV